MKTIKLLISSLLLLSLLLAITSCNCDKKEGGVNNDYMILATAWYQNAGEVQALYHQGFAIARLRLDEDLRTVKGGKKRAIVLDVDETIVDNSPYQATNALKNRHYKSENWFSWVKMEKATATAGAVDFLKYVESKGVEIFYITNRKVRGLEETYRNLKAIGFPVKKENLILRVKSSNKDSRRAIVEKDHRVVLFMGDSLTDFPGGFDKHLTKNTAGRNAAVEREKREFGKKFIVFPNPMYGDWEQAFYDFNYKKTLKEKDADRKKVLRPEN